MGRTIYGETDIPLSVWAHLADRQNVVDCTLVSLQTSLEASILCPHFTPEKWFPFFSDNWQLWFPKPAGRGTIYSAFYHIFLALNCDCHNYHNLLILAAHPNH